MPSWLCCEEKRLMIHTEEARRQRAAWSSARLAAIEAELWNLRGEESQL
jgi:hypothetical protein